MKPLLKTYNAILEPFFIWFVLPSVVIICATAPPQIAPMFYSDTLTHIATFCVLMTVFGFRCKNFAALCFAAIALFMFGCFIEGVQSYLPHRQMSAQDVAANIGGIGLGLCALFAIKRLRDLLKLEV